MFFYIHLDFFCYRNKNNWHSKKVATLVTVLGSGIAATANVYEVSEPRVGSCYASYSFKDWRYSTGSFASLWNILDLHFFMIKWHCNQKSTIFGILSSGNLGPRNQFWFKLLEAASTASDLKYLKNQVIWGYQSYEIKSPPLTIWWFNQSKLFKLFKLNWC